MDPRADEAALIEADRGVGAGEVGGGGGSGAGGRALDELRRADEATGVPARQRGRGVASAGGVGATGFPARGGRHLGFAKAAVRCRTPWRRWSGALSEWRATLIVRESACLNIDDRRTLDAELCADISKLDGVGDARIVAAAKEVAYRLDAQAVVDRVAKAAVDVR